MVKNRNRWMNSLSQQRPRGQSLTQERRCGWKQDLNHWNTFPTHIGSGIQGHIKYNMPARSYCTLHRWANTMKEQKSSWVSSLSEERHKHDLILVMFLISILRGAYDISSAAVPCTKLYSAGHEPEWTASSRDGTMKPLSTRTQYKLALFRQNNSEGFIRSVLKWHYSLFGRTSAG